MSPSSQGPKLCLIQARESCGKSPVREEERTIEFAYVATKARKLIVQRPRDRPMPLDDAICMETRAGELPRALNVDLGSPRRRLCFPFCVLSFRQIITFLWTASGGSSDCGVMFETEFPVPGRTPTGAHPHVAHADGIRIMPFHEDSTVLTARSHRDEALEPRDREPLVLVLAEQTRRVHAYLTSHTNVVVPRESEDEYVTVRRFAARNAYRTGKES